MPIVSDLAGGVTCHHDFFANNLIIISFIAPL